MLCSKGAADHVTERTYGSKEKELLHWIAELEKEQKAKKGRLKTQVDKDAAGYWKGKEKEQEIEGMGIEEKRDKDKWGTLHCRDLGLARNFMNPLTQGYVNSDGEVLREKDMALTRALAGAKEIEKEMALEIEALEIEKEMALKMLEIKADEALMPELYREMSEWQKRNQWDIDHAEANKDGKIRMLSRMQDEVPNKWWKKVIEKAMKEVRDEMGAESGGAASSKCYEMAVADGDVVEMAVMDDDGATSSNCYFKV